MKSFLKSFGEVIVSSNLRETKGYNIIIIVQAGFLFLWSENKCREK